MARPRRSPTSPAPTARVRAGTVLACVVAVVVGVPLFAVTAYGVSSALTVVAAAPPSCDERPEHPRCQDPPPCDVNPDHPRCDGREDDAGRPELVNEFPRDGATGVSRFTDVRAHFSEAVFGVNTRTFRLFDSKRDFFVSAEVFRGGGGSRWVLDPDRRLARDTRYVAVLRGRGNGIEDAAGNSLLSTRWSFRTGD